MYEHDTGVRGGFCAAKLGMPPRIAAMSGPWAVNSNLYRKRNKNRRNNY